MRADRLLFGNPSSTDIAPPVEPAGSSQAESRAATKRSFPVSANRGREKRSSNSPAIEQRRRGRPLPAPSTLSHPTLKPFSEQTESIFR